MARAVSIKGKATAGVRLNLTLWNALNPASATKKKPGTTKIERPPISANADMIPLSIQVAKSASPIQRVKGPAATIKIRTTIELSPVSVPLSSPTCRNKNETAR